MNKLIASNGQIITEIVNKQGRVLFKCDRCFQSLDELDLTEAELCGIVCEGLWCIGTNFTEADLRGADLYWAMALEANFSGADLSNADLRGAFLAAANFTAPISPMPGSVVTIWVVQRTCERPFSKEPSSPARISQVQPTMRLRSFLQASVPMPLRWCGPTSHTLEFTSIL